MAHVPCPTRVIDPVLARFQLDAQANKFLSIDYYKVDGTLATVNGQLKAASRLVGNARGAAQSAAMKDRGQVWIAKPNGKSGSFYIDRIVAIRASKATITATA